MDRLVEDPSKTDIGYKIISFEFREKCVTPMLIRPRLLLPDRSLHAAIPLKD